MIPKRELLKRIKTTRTRRYTIVNDNLVARKLPKAQKTLCIYKNEGLKYLYQHYGVSHIGSPFPTGMARKYLINDMVKFARYQAKKHGFNLKKFRLNIQAVDKMLEGLCVNFIKYRRGQYKQIHYWSDNEKKRYLRLHKCNLSGYGRINYNHYSADIKTITFKCNGNRIKLINNYCLRLPYFGNIQTKQSLTQFKHRHITEARIKVRDYSKHDFELQIITGLDNQKHLTRQQAKGIVGLDVNLKDDKFFDLSDGQVLTWSEKLKHQYELADHKARYLQHIITTHNHGNDNCNLTKSAKRQLYRLKAKLTNRIDEWQLHVAHQFAKHYPVFAMEHLSTFMLRISKRDKRYKLRKNTNHKLAIIHPTKFRRQMEDVYQDKQELLIEVNPIDTSKTCHHCGHINHNLGLQKLWKCPHCQQWIHRDPNATYNIRDWAINPKKHAVLKQPKRYPYLQNPQDLVEYI